jgi:hypothetical protein
VGRHRPRATGSGGDGRQLGGGDDRAARIPTSGRSTAAFMRQSMVTLLPRKDPLSTLSPPAPTRTTE